MRPTAPPAPPGSSPTLQATDAVAPLPPPSTPPPTTPPSPSPSPSSANSTTHNTLLITTLPPAPQEWSSDSLQEGVGVRLSRAPTIPQLDGGGVSPAPSAPSAPSAPPAPSAPSTIYTTPLAPRYVPPYRRNEIQGLWTDYVDEI